MQCLKWYVFRIENYLYRIKCEAWYINQLYKDEAIKMCFQYNNKRRIKNGDKKI